MFCYKIIIAYDGTHYHGWQVQKDRISIAYVLQDVFQRVFGESISLRAVSRTDAGVHALGQVAVFKTSLAIEPKNLQWAWNNSLPEDITIRSLERVALDYNPHENIQHKTYIYHFFDRQPSPFIARYGWHVRKKIDMQKLHETLQIFIGTHDFRSFSTGDDRGEDTIRTIHSITLRYIKRHNAYVVIIKGPKFLRHMIRRIVGAAMTSATSDISLQAIRDVLIHKNPCHTLLNAPSKGLALYKISYTNEINNTHI